MGPSLNSWQAYLEAVAPKKPDAKLSTFHARFKFAANLESINVYGMGEGTLLIYSAITKVAFSYSALEHLEQSLGIQGKPPIHALDLAKKVKLAMPNGITRVTDRMSLAQSLEARLNDFFKKENSSDVRPVIEQFRHSLFHGKFTPAGWGLKGIRRHEELLEGLAQVTLRKANDTFAKWFRAQNF